MSDVRVSGMPPLPHVVGPACPCWDCRIWRAADEAIANRWPVGVDDIWLVPDHLVTAASVTGMSLPETWRLVRDDGEIVHIYRTPDSHARWGAG